MSRCGPPAGLHYAPSFCNALTLREWDLEHVLNLPLFYDDLGMGNEFHPSSHCRKETHLWTTTILCRFMFVHYARFAPDGTTVHPLAGEISAMEVLNERGQC